MFNRVIEDTEFLRLRLQNPELVFPGLSAIVTVESKKREYGEPETSVQQTDTSYDYETEVRGFRNLEYR